MANWDWDKFGDDIRKTVQDAVDSQDFRKLNQTITNTVNEAMGTLVDGVKNSAQRNAGRDAYRKAVREARRGPETYQYGSEQVGNAQAVVESRYAAVKKGSPFFVNVTATTVVGTVLAAAGYSLMGIFLVVLLMILIGGLAMGAVGGGLTISMALFAILAAGTGIIGGIGLTMRREARRFRKYIQELSGREYCDFKELSDKLGRPVKFLLKDIRRMIHKGWFKQGHIDNQNTCLIVSNEAYSQYLNLIEQAQQKELLEEAEEVRQEQAELEPEVQDIIKTGDAYIRKIHECNEAIPAQEISAKISRMEMLVDRIFGRVKEHPESISEIRRLMEYYLPTTVKLLEAYEELDAQPVQGENIKVSKMEIEKTLDTLNIAFEKILDGMFQSTAWDVSTDISVLQTMLAQEGLTKDDFK